jgi:hypothetical protein
MYLLCECKYVVSDIFDTGVDGKVTGDKWQIWR